jgi:hypothetical protein
MGSKLLTENTIVRNRSWPSIAGVGRAKNERTWLFDIAAGGGCGQAAYVSENGEQVARRRHA